MVMSLAEGLSMALHEWLTANHPLTGGWYPQRLPDGIPTAGGFLAGTYQRISGARTNTHSGATARSTRRVQLTIYSDTYRPGYMAAMALLTALNGVRIIAGGWEVVATIADDGEDVDPEPRGLFRQRVDVMTASEVP